MSPIESPRLLRRRTVVVVIILTGTVLSFLSFRWLSQNDRARIEADFIRRADIRTALTAEVINNFEARLFGLRHLFIGSDHVTRTEFSLAAQDIIARYDGISALQWVPAVPQAARADIEALATQELGQPFEFTTRDPTGRLIRSPAISEHYPILYVEPLAGNEPALGYDLAFGPTTAELARARQTGRMAVSRIIQLVQDPTAGRSGVVFIWPVYHRTPHAEHFIGYVQGVFRLQDIFEESFKLQAGAALDALYLDPAETDPARRAFYYRPAAAAATPPPDEATFRQGLVLERRLALGDREWLVLYRPDAGWLRAQRNHFPVWRLIGGLTLTALLVALIHTLGRRTEGIEQEVAQRTAELSESRRQLESLMQALPGMAYRCRYDRQMTPLYFSEGALALCGYPAEDLMSGRVHARDLVHPDDLAFVRDTTRDALQEHRPFELEYRIRTREGGVKWVLSRGRGVYAADGTLLFFEGLVIDISTRKQAEADKLAIERRLLGSQKLESLGLLAGGVAHDFNNLLTSIVGNAGLARLDLPPGSPADTCLRQIETASQHAAELCQQMLAYAGKGRVAMESLDLDGLLEAMLPLVQPSINRAVQLRLNLARNLPPVLGDASQLRQIAMNLILNAGDAIGDQPGEITVTTAVESIAAATFAECVAGRELTPGRYVTLTVRDTGRGMVPEVLAKIFDPFFTTKFAGRGLGLAATLGIVRGHGGALQVTSAAGRGSTFRLFLPPVGTAAPAAPAAPAAGATILIIDDDRPVCEITAEVLRSLGHEAVVAQSGQEGITLFRENPSRYTLILLDLLMPGLSGAETLQRLRAIRSDVRVIVMSGLNDTRVMQQLPANSPMAFITKPFTRDGLAGKLREVLEV